MILCLLVSSFGYGQYSHRDSLKLKIIDSLVYKMFQWGSNRPGLINDTALKYGMLCLTIDKQISENRFVYVHIVEAYFNKGQYDSAYKYGNIFLKIKIKTIKSNRDANYYSKGRNFQLLTSDILYQIDTSRHNYKQAVKYLITHNPDEWWSGSATNFNERMKRYYINIIDCYIKMGEIAKANRYKRKLEKDYSLNPRHGFEE